MQINHQPYSKEEHWKAFWRTFYNQMKKKKVASIKISEEMVEEAKSFCQLIVEAKKTERVHQIDSNNEWKRWMTGVLGEIALESFLGVPFRDKSIGHSKSYAVPDLSPLNLRIGVKSFRVGNFPLVNRSKKLGQDIGRRKEMDGQIFIGIDLNRRMAYLFGLAFEEELYQNEDNPSNNRYVKDSNALDRKVAFTSLDSLYHFSTLEELKFLANQHNRLMAI